MFIIIVSCSYLNYCSQSFFPVIQPLILSCIFAFIYSFHYVSFLQSIRHSMHSFMHACKHSFKRVHLILLTFSCPVFDCVFTHYCFSFINSFMSPSIHLSIHSFIQSFIHAFLHSSCIQAFKCFTIQHFLVLFHFGLFIQSLVSFY